MTTLLGPMPCKGCRVHVWLVRRRVAFRCSSHGRVCSSPCLVPTIVEADGTTHLCEQSNACSGIIGDDGSSVTDSDTMCDGRITARSSGAAVSCHGRI